MIMLYIRKLFTQDLRDGKQIAFPKEPSNSFFSFDYAKNDPDRNIAFTFKAVFEQFQEFDGTVINTRLYAAGSESRMDGQVKAFIRDKLHAKVDDLLIFKTNGNKHTEFEVMFVPQSNKYYLALCTLLGKDNHTVISIVSESDQTYPLQQIFYGAPGTGKSFEISKRTKGKEVIRTTFHPDSDYSTFVGAYKPTTTEENRYGLNGSDTVALKYPDGERSGKVISDKKIDYRFVKQAFLKAYIKAWKYFAQSIICNSSTSYSPIELVSLTNDKDSWLLDSLDDQYVYYTKKSVIPLTDYEQLVKKCWESIVNSENPDVYDLGTTERYQATVCLWYKDNYSVNNTSEECWNVVLGELNQGKKIEFCPGGNQYYTAVLENDSIIIKSNNRAKRVTIEKIFNDSQSKMSGSVQMSIANKLKEYNENFDEAWNKLKEEIGEDSDSRFCLIDLNKITPLFLIIEEINRGNCAQIFGDLFQLLDRKNGFSEYPIEADEDIRKALLDIDTEDNPSFGKDGLKLSEEQRKYINDFFNKNNDEYTPYRDVASEIANGKVLVLPCNLYIWATMNTSDQSLFPMDSAFKRRWEWEYIPIDYEDAAKFHVRIGDDYYKWDKIILEINKKIKKANSSADKQLGNRFAMADKDNIISSKTFVNKVLFYLWNDIFKDVDDEDQIFKCITYYEDFFTTDDIYTELDTDKINIDKVKKFIEDLNNGLSDKDKLKPDEEFKSKMSGGATVPISSLPFTV